MLSCRKIVPGMCAVFYVKTMYMDFLHFFPPFFTSFVTTDVGPVLPALIPGEHFQLIRTAVWCGIPIELGKALLGIHKK